jgi:hypothetical protein
VTVQVLAEISIGVYAVDPPDTDGFVSADCDEAACRYRLEQEPGDGRIRRAELLLEPAAGTHDEVEVVEDEELTERWIAAATEVIERAAAA